MATDITVSFQAITDAELATNDKVNQKGMITYSNTKIRLGTGADNIDYLQLLKDDIIDQGIPLVYHGQKTTVEIDDATTGYPTMKNGLVYDTNEQKLYYIKKVQTNTDYKEEIPISASISGNLIYSEKYIAGNHITIDENKDGTKTINAVLNGFSGYAIYETMPTNAELTKPENANKIFFVL